MRRAQSIDLPAMLRAIRAECSKQGIDDDTRRAIMMDKAGVSSQRDLDAAGAKRVLDHLRRTGGNSAPAARRPNEWDWVNHEPNQTKRDRLWKIRRLCIAAGIKEGGQQAYAEGIAAQMRGAAPSAGPVCHPLKMCDAGELWRIIAALAEHAMRRGKNPNDARADA